MDKEQKKLLEEKFGKEEAKKIISLQKKCDKFLIKFKQEMNPLIKPHNLEVLCGVVYKELDQQQ